MNGYLKYFLVLLVLFSGVLKVQAAPDDLTKNVSSSKVVFLIPHQDDEMFMAGAIKRAIDSRLDVYAVVVTDGGASIVRKNEKLKEDIGYGAKEISRRSFVFLRNEEFFNSMSDLGVKKENIIFANPGGIDGSEEPLYIDGEFSKKDAVKMVKEIYKKIGDGKYITLVSDPDISQNPDHESLFMAVLNSEDIKSREFYSENKTFGKKILLSNQERVAKLKALNNYYRWNPKKGNFAIGAQSVRKMLDFWKYNKFEYLVEKP